MMRPLKIDVDAPFTWLCSGCGKIEFGLTPVARHEYRKGRRVFYHDHKCANAHLVRRGIGLEKVVAMLLTMQDASTWVEEHKAEFNITHAPKPPTLRAAAESGRLGAVKIGGVYVTREAELREYMAQFCPKNRSNARAQVDE